VHKKHTAEKKKTRTEALKIPENVKPGTADAVYYDLRNSIYIGKEAIAKSEEADKKGGGRGLDSSRREQIREMERQQAILSQTLFGQYWDNDPKKIPGEQQEGVSRNISATEAMEFIRKEQIDPLENLKSKYHLGIGTEAEKRLKSAYTVLDRLTRESSKGKEREDN